MKTLTPADFARAIGQPNLTPRCEQILREVDMRYEKVGISKYATIVADIERACKDPVLKVTDQGREAKWEDCWAKTLTVYSRTSSPEALIPDYLSAPYQHVLRLEDHFIQPLQLHFHLNFWRALRTQLFERWFINAGTVYELGSGSAWNLLALQELVPGGITCWGLDYSPSAVTLASLVSNGGWRFNLQHPISTFTPPHFAVLTVGALEQIGTEYGPLLVWLLEQRPDLCLHVEPLLELYDPADPFDRLAIDYHTARGYLNGFLPALYDLQLQGQAEVLTVHRVRFGGIYNEGYSYVVWRPVYNLIHLRKNKLGNE